MKFETCEEKAIRFTVKLSEGIDNYAKDFLVLSNCKRENPEYFLKLENQNESNNIYATFLYKQKDTAQEYLEQFGEIINIENVNVVIITAELSDEEEEKYYEKSQDRFMLMLED